MVPFSPVVSLSIRPKKAIFTTQKDVLILHSDFFRDQFTILGEDAKIALPEAEPLAFLDYLSWIYTGEFVHLHKLNQHMTIQECYELGTLLRAPAYQNAVMDICRDMQSSLQLSQDSTVETTFLTCRKGSKLRKFVAHCIARDSPFEKYKEDSNEYKKWTALLQKWPDLSLEIATIAGKKWNSTYPWYDGHRAAYVEHEEDLGEQRDKQILLSRDIDEIRRAAEDGCMQSMVELDHLKRDVD